MTGNLTSLQVLSLVAIVASAGMLLGHLLRKPPLDLRHKLWLLLALGVLPAIAAASSTVAGMEATTERRFCGSCHVMTPYVEDAERAGGSSLASRHSVNPFFGKRSCYVCHANYGMFGYAMTKLSGMRHVYLYYLGGYRQMSLEQAREEIHLAHPYQNINCRQCHSTTPTLFRSVPDHKGLSEELEADRVSCVSAGCHGYAHPFSKTLPSGEAKEHR